MHWPSGFSMVASLTYIERPKWGVSWMRIGSFEKGPGF